MVFTVHVVFVCQFVVSAGVSTALTLPILLVYSRFGVVQYSLTEDHTHTVYKEE